MNRTHVSADLVTLDATVDHPGFSPFATMKARRKAQHELNTMDLDLAQMFCLSMIAQGQTPPAHIALPPEAVQLAQFLRDS